MDINLCPPDTLIVEHMDTNLCLPGKLLLDLLVMQMEKKGSFSRTLTSPDEHKFMSSC